MGRFTVMTGSKRAFVPLWGGQQRGWCLRLLPPLPHHVTNELEEHEDAVQVLPLAHTLFERLCAVLKLRFQLRGLTQTVGDKRRVGADGVEKVGLRGFGGTVGRILHTYSTGLYGREGMGAGIRMGAGSGRP